MQYLHQSHYGHAGGFHTAKPIMALSGGHIYDIKDGRPDLTKPLYRVSGTQVYKTGTHPDGPSLHAVFQIHGDKVHTTEYHPAHVADRHVFEIRRAHP